MTPVEFDPFHYIEILEWYAAWEESPPPVTMLPRNGIIIPGVCAGFLYLTDSRLGILDCYISNPSASKEDVNIGLDVLTNELMDVAKSNGCEALMATSNISKVKQRAEKHGFIYRGETSVYLKEL